VQTLPTEQGEKPETERVETGDMMKPFCVSHDEVESGQQVGPPGHPLTQSWIAPKLCPTATGQPARIRAVTHLRGP